MFFVLKSAKDSSITGHVESRLVGENQLFCNRELLWAFLSSKPVDSYIIFFQFLAAMLFLQYTLTKFFSWWFSKIKFLLKMNRGTH